MLSEKVARINRITEVATKLRITAIELVSNPASRDIEYLLVRKIRDGVERLDLEEPAGWVRLRQAMNMPGSGC